jgi:hypothetical protein
VSRRLLVLATVAAVLACAGSLWKVLAARAGPAPLPAWDFPRLPIEQVSAPVPPRFSGPLPSRVEGFWQQVEKGPPLAHVRLRLLEGDREMSERFLSALRQAAARAGDSLSLKDTYGKALWFESFRRYDDGVRLGPSRDEIVVPCGWLRQQLEAPGGEHPYIRELFWWKLALCSGPEVEELFTREEAPRRLVLEQYLQYGPPRFTAAMDQLVRRLLAEDQQELFRWAVGLLLRSAEPAAQARVEELARQARGEAAEKIREARADRQRQEEYFARQCRFVPVDPDGVDQFQIDLCLERWARVDWGATARLASLLLARPGFSEFHQENFAILARFASTAGRDVWAQERGLLPEPLPAQEDPPGALYLASRMLTARRAVLSYALRGPMDFPLQHDELLVTLTWMVRPELRGVVFEEVPPAVDALTGMAMDGHTLHAYADGERFSIKTLNQESWLDIGAVLALLNRLLEVRGSTTRFAALGHHTHPIIIVSGPAAALREAHALRLLWLGDAREVVAEVRKGSERFQKELLGIAP